MSLRSVAQGGGGGVIPTRPTDGLEQRGGAKEMPSEQFPNEARRTDWAGPRREVPESPGALSVETHVEGDTIVIALSGELDLATADLVREALDNAHARRPQRLVIDLGELDFIDTTGLALVVYEAKRDRSDEEPQLEIWPGPPQIQRMFNIAGALERLPFVGLS